MVELNCAPEFLQISSEGIRNRLRAIPRERPTHGVSRHAKHKAERSGSKGLQWKECMCQHARRKKRGGTETGELERMLRQMKDRLQELVREIFPVAHQRPH